MNDEKQYAPGLKITTLNGHKALSFGEDSINMAVLRAIMETKLNRVEKIKLVRVVMQGGLYNAKQIYDAYEAFHALFNPV